MNKRFQTKGRFRRLFITLMLSGMAAGIYAADITDVPYTFQSGTPSSAGEINSNFDHLEDRSWEKSGTDLNYIDGNVGIGTVSPSKKLEVNGTMAFTGGTGPMCIFSTTCPTGWIDKGLGGYLYNSTGGATCPYNPGAAYNNDWNWCHPIICCNE